MGLDLYCNGISAKCASYSTIQKIRYDLLISLKDYLEIELMYEIDSDEKDIMVEYIMDLCEKRNSINYKKQNLFFENYFRKYSINGFFCFVFHSDCSGTIDSYQAKQFMKTFEIVKDYIPNDLKNQENNFYLNQVFQESIHSSEDIFFV